MTINKTLQKVIDRVLGGIDENSCLRLKNVSSKSCLIVNENKRRAVLITINALDAKGRQVLAFGITFRKSNWDSQLKNYSEMDLLGKLSSSSYKSIPLDKISTFI